VRLPKSYRPSILISLSLLISFKTPYIRHPCKTEETKRPAPGIRNLLVTIHDMQLISEWRGTKRQTVAEYYLHVHKFAGSAMKIITRSAVKHY
jgi:hypothetical protein